jgi:hypothetical protein
LAQSTRRETLGMAALIAASTIYYLIRRRVALRSAAHD